MKPLLSALNDIPEYRSLLAAIDNGACPAAFSGLSAVHRAHFAAGIRQELNRPVVVVCADEGEAERMPRDLAALSGACQNLNFNNTLDIILMHSIQFTF